MRKIILAGLILLSSSLNAQDTSTRGELNAIRDISSVDDEAKANEVPVGQDEETDESTENADSAVASDEVAGDFKLTGTRSWRAPNYGGQEKVIGWKPETFHTPPALEKNVKFWIDIYTKYSTDQGLLHDSENIDLIYETLDFSHISARRDLNSGQKERMRTKLVKEGKKRIEVLLKKLEKVKDPTSLSAEEKRVYDYFQTISEKDKFKEAARKGRLRFQLGQRDRLIQGIFFSGRYLEDFERIFREAGLPVELTRLPFVESSFNVLARSRVGASGLWQIMSYTARRQLMMNAAIDKRNHPIEATKMATKILRYNYELLDSWPLAITGYNHGPAGVKRLTQTLHTRDLAELGRGNSYSGKGKKRRLGFASRNFFPSLLAILEVESKAPFYFGTLNWSQPLQAYDLVLDRPVRWSQVLKWFDGNEQMAQIYNPHVTSAARSLDKAIPARAVISVPQTRKTQVMSEVQNMPMIVPATTASTRTPPKIRARPRISDR